MFYLKKGAVDKLGNSPIMGRITIGRTMAQFSCKLSCDAKLWNTRESRLNGKSKVAVATNDKIECLLLSIKEAYNSLLSRNRDFQAEDVKNLFQGGVENQMMLIQLIDQMTADIVARVGIDRAKTTPLSYHGVRRNLAEFIKLKFKTSDIAFGQLNEQLFVIFTTTPQSRRIIQWIQFVTISPLSRRHAKSPFARVIPRNCTLQTIHYPSRSSHLHAHSVARSLSRYEIWRSLRSKSVIVSSVICLYLVVSQIYLLWVIS